MKIGLIDADAISRKKATYPNLALMKLSAWHKSLGIQPYVMVYRQDTASDDIKRLKRYANNPYVCWGTKRFADYVSGARSDRYQKTGMKHKDSGITYQ